jgi:hypothetical protein
MFSEKIDEYLKIANDIFNTQPKTDDIEIVLKKLEK